MTLGCWYQERQRSELNRLKASAVITDSPPVKRQAVPGSSQVDVRQSPLVQVGCRVACDECVCAVVVFDLENCVVSRKWFLFQPG